MNLFYGIGTAMALCIRLRLPAALGLWYLT